MGSQAAPTVEPTAVHVPVVAMAAATHAAEALGARCCVALHCPPAVTNVAHVPPAHVSPGPQLSRFTQEVPAVGAAWQVPQADAGGTPQKADVH